MWRKFLVLAAVLLVSGGVMYRGEIKRLYTEITLFDEGRIVPNFSSMGSAFRTVELPRGNGPLRALPQNNRLDLPQDVKAWFQARSTTSLIVLHHGEVVFEDYYLGTHPEDLRIAWSVSKSWLSVLLGIVLEEGHIASLDDPVVRYASSLSGSAYDGVSIRDVLTMSSGVAFDENYLDFWSDINRMGSAAGHRWKHGPVCGLIHRTFGRTGTGVVICLHRHACHWNGHQRRNGKDNP